MKTTAINYKRAKGVTLLELTVVILVLLTLISVLFIGANAWKKGSDRATNILNVRNVQNAVRGEQNMKALSEGDPLLNAVLFTGDDNFLQEPTPPGNATDGSYNYLDEIPAVGALYVTNPTLGDGDTYFYADADEYSGW